jgi:hypothetical protein
MKLRIDKIGGAVTKDDGTINIAAVSKGKVHTIEIATSAWEQFVFALLASSSDPSSATSKTIHPVGLGRFQTEENIGLSFYMAPNIALHLVLARPLANNLREVLDTFDDSSTWDVSKPH